MRIRFSSHEDILPERRWDEEDEDPILDCPSPDLAIVSDEDLFAAPASKGRLQRGKESSAVSAEVAIEAGISVGRLDGRLRAAPEPVRIGWEARMMLLEAAASARLDGHLLDAGDLLAWECGLGHEGAPSPALSAGLQILDILRLAARRSPRSFWTPRRLTRLAGVIGRRTGDRMGALPGWLREQRAERQTAAEGLARIFMPERIEAWRSRSPLLVGAEIVTLWHEEGLADSVGGCVGRVLAVAWPWRMGVLDGLSLPVSAGFLGHAGDFAPWRLGWEEAWLRGVDRAARRGLDLLSELTRQHDRLMQASLGRRSSSRLPRLAQVMIERPAIGSTEAASLIGTTKQGILNMLEELKAAGHIQEISKRGSHWVWQATPA